MSSDQYDHLDKYAYKTTTAKITPRVNEATKLIARSLGVPVSMLLGAICHDFVENYETRVDGIKERLFVLSDGGLAQKLQDLGFETKQEE